MDILSQEVIIVIVACLFFLFVAIGIIILFLVYQKKQLLYIIERKEMSNQFQKELLKTRLEAQEETLLKLSKELHDNIGQLLSSSKMLIGVAERSMPSTYDTLQLADETLSKAIHELRTMSKSLNKEWLEKFSLIENIESEVSRINATKEINVSFEHPEKITLSGDRQLLLFRIAQEAFQNSLKHGKASVIKIFLTELDSQLNLLIEDNGIGFNHLNVDKPGLGLTNIKHRAQVMGGKASWHKADPGTIVEIQLPIFEKTS